MAENDTSLVALNLSVMGMNDVQSKHLVEALGKNTCLKLLILYENNIGNIGVCAFASLLKTNNHCALEELWLPFNNIGDAGAVWLAEGIKESKSIRCLRLDGNHIGPEGAKAIGEILPKLVELHISENQIGNEGAKGLVCGLLRNDCSLEQLHVSANEIGNEGARAFEKMLCSNRGLRSVAMGLNAFDDMGASSLVRGMEQNFTIQSFSLFGMDSSWQKDINFHVRLNKAGRRILREDCLPLSLWADFLAKLCKEPTLMHYFVQAKPDLFQNYPRCYLE